MYGTKKKWNDKNRPSWLWTRKRAPFRSYHGIFESITPDTIYLKKYLNDDTSKMLDVCQTASWAIDKFIQLNEEYDIPELEEMENYEKVDFLIEKFPDFVENFYNHIMKYDYDDPDLYHSSATAFDGGKYVRNDWFIHYTDYAEDIYDDGFTRGVPVYEMDELGITVGRQNRNVKFDNSEGLYIFAFRANSKHDEFKYGKDAVMFQASAVETYHYGDEERQCIVDTKSIRNIIPIKAGELPIG